MDKTIEQYFIEHRQGMGYTDEQIQAELLVKQTGLVKHLLQAQADHHIHQMRLGSVVLRCIRN